MGSKHSAPPCMAFPKHRGPAVWRFCLILSWAKLISGSIICLIMGSKYSGPPVRRFQNTVGLCMALFLFAPWPSQSDVISYVGSSGSMNECPNTTKLLHPDLDEENQKTNKQTKRKGIWIKKSDCLEAMPKHQKWLHPDLKKNAQKRSHIDYISQWFGNRA